jgi:hypothetical protein
MTRKTSSKRGAVVALPLPAKSPDAVRWHSAYSDLEVEVRDLRRIMQIALIVDDAGHDDDPDSSGRVRIVNELAERTANELVEKWDAGFKAAKNG